MSDLGPSPEGPNEFRAGGIHLRTQNNRFTLVSKKETQLAVSLGSARSPDMLPDTLFAWSVGRSKTKM